MDMPNEEDFMVEKFDKDDKGYLEWRKEHPNGYIVNYYWEPKLHRVNCGSLLNPIRKGLGLTNDYPKICSNNRSELESLPQEQVGGELTLCGLCFRS